MRSQDTPIPTATVSTATIPAIEIGRSVTSDSASSSASPTKKSESLNFRIESLFQSISRIALKIDPESMGLQGESLHFVRDPVLDNSGRYTDKDVFLEHYSDLLFYLIKVEGYLLENQSQVDYQKSDARFQRSSEASCALKPSKKNPFSFDQIKALQLDLELLKAECVGEFGSTSASASNASFPFEWSQS